MFGKSRQAQVSVIFCGYYFTLAGHVNVISKVPGFGRVFKLLIILHPDGDAKI